MSNIEMITYIINNLLLVNTFDEETAPIEDAIIYDKVSSFIKNIAINNYIEKQKNEDKEVDERGAISNRPTDRLRLKHGHYKYLINCKPFIKIINNEDRNLTNVIKDFLYPGEEVFCLNYKEVYNLIKVLNNCFEFDDTNRKWLINDFKIEDKIIKNMNF